MNFFVFSEIVAELSKLDVWIQAILLFGVSLVFLKIFQLVILNRLRAFSKKTKNDLDDVFITIISDIKPGLYVIFSLYLGLQPFTLVHWLDVTINIIFILIVANFAIKSILRLLDYGVKKYIARKQHQVGEEQAEHTEGMLKIFRGIIFVILWVSVMLLILSNNGVNITSLIASLGIAGIAVALALQNVLSDLFASFSIFLDSPFKVGDYIQFGESDGVVEKIGIRSTNIRTLQGELLIVPNQQLISSEIQNFRRMQRRREVMQLGIVYEVSAEIIKKIPMLLEEIISGIDNCTFDRSHFDGFGDSALLYETVYHIEAPEYDKYMDVKHEVNSQIFERFEKEGIGFAYPTQTLYLQK